MANQMQADLTLLDLPLKRSGAIIASVMGEFTAPGAQEIVVLRPGGLIELLRIETEEAARPAGDDSDEEEELSTGIKLVNRTETQSVLRSLEAVRLSGSKRDVLAVGADGGRLTVLDF